MNTKKTSKICDICGDKGRARNFGAMTCESCKSFFRRNGLKNEIPNCPSNGKCNINVMTRRQCTKCRLEKCIAFGMKSELIRSDEQNKCRKELIKENKSKHKPRDESHNCVNFSPNYSQNDSIISDTTIDENFMSDLLDNNLFDFIDTKEEFNSFENNKNKTSIRDNSLQELPVIPVFKTISDYNGINQLESKRISELLIASNTIFKHPLQSNAIIHRIKDWDEFADKFQEYNELFIRLIIQFTKSLNGFNTICADDKYALMKYGIRDLTVIRGLKYYDKYNHSFITPIDHDYSIQYDLELFMPADRTSTLITYYNKFLSIWNYDDPILIELLTAIALFNPNRPNLLHRNSVRLEQQLYIYLLQRYLLLKYRSESESQLKVQQIMNSLKDVNFLNQMQTKSFGESDVYLKHFGPLMREICSP